MFYEAELRLLRNTLQKCRVQTAIYELPSEHHNENPWSRFFRTFQGISLPSSLFPSPEQERLYRLVLPLGCRYLFFLLPELTRDTLLVIGPYITQPPAPEQIIELSEYHHIPPNQLKALEAYLGSIPILPETSHIFVLLDAFAERIWGTRNYVVEDIAGDAHGIIPALEKKALSQDAETVQWNIENLEVRYSYESELMEAVSKGQTHKADLLLSNFSTFSFEQRLSDPVRNAKNYCIIMNTLLRKAAQEGGVHPLYLDNTSSVYAHRIEQLEHLDSVSSLMSEMFRAYCRLVRNHSLSGYSPLIQKAITYIDAELTGELRLHTLAGLLNVSSSYLSTLFKKEVGKTLTEYVTQRRIAHAKHLLKSTRLQVQTVAQHCGLEDVQYFSRIFKRLTGMTPRQFREHSNI